MAVTYKLGNSRKARTDDGFMGQSLLFETDDRIELEGKVHNKKTLVKENDNRMERKMYSGMARNSESIMTRTRAFHTEHDFRLVGGILPQRPNATILENNVKFDDGTEIVALETVANPRGGLVKYKHGEIVGFRRLINTRGKMSLVKVDEGSFIAIRNKYDYTFYGRSSIVSNSSYMDQANAETMTYAGYSGNSTIIGSGLTLISSIYSNNISSSATSMNTNGTSYDLHYRSDLAVLMDKNLNVIKEVEVDGEIHNAIGRGPNGELILLVQEYVATLSSPDYNRSFIRIISLSKDMVQTVLYSYRIRASDSMGSSSYGFGLTSPTYDPETGAVTFLDLNEGLAIKKITVDFSSLTVTASDTAIDLTSTILNGAASRYYHLGGVDYNTGQYRLSVETINDNGETLYLITPLVHSMMEVLISDYNYASKLATSPGYMNGVTYLSSLARSYLSSYSYSAFLVGADGAVRDSVPYSDMIGDGPLACFPVGENFFLIVKRKSLTLYKVEAGKIVIVESISEPIRALGVDDEERIWFVRESENSDLEMISPFLSLDVSVTFEDTSLTYIDTEIETAINIEAKTMAGEMKELELRLVLEGNAVFRETGSRRVTVTTSATQPVRVPIVITGSGAVNVYPTVEE
jgi:hypothetical protein